MTIDLSRLIDPLVIQLDYYKKLMENRNQYGNQAMKTEISSILKDLEFKKTPLDLIYHGLNTLYFNLQKMDKTVVKISKWNKEEYNNPVEAFLGSVEGIIDYGRSVLSDVSLKSSEVTNSLSDEKNQIEERYTKTIAHCIHHIGQALIFHGLICKYLER